MRGSLVSGREKCQIPLLFFKKKKKKIICIKYMCREKTGRKPQNVNSAYFCRMQL